MANQNCFSRIILVLLHITVANFSLSLESLISKFYFRHVHLQDLVTEVQRSLYETLNEFTGNVEDEHDLESLIEQQFEVLQKALKIPHKATEARLMVSKKFLTLFRTGKLGPFVLDDVPDSNPS